MHSMSQSRSPALFTRPLSCALNVGSTSQNFPHYASDQTTRLPRKSAPLPLSDCPSCSRRAAVKSKAGRAPDGIPSLSEAGPHPMTRWLRKLPGAGPWHGFHAPASSGQEDASDLKHRPTTLSAAGATTGGQKGELRSVEPCFDDTIARKYAQPFRNFIVRPGGGSTMLGAGQPAHICCP